MRNKLYSLTATNEEDQSKDLRSSVFGTPAFLEVVCVLLSVETNFGWEPYDKFKLKDCKLWERVQKLSVSRIVKQSILWEWLIGPPIAFYWGREEISHVCLLSHLFSWWDQKCMDEWNKLWTAACTDKLFFQLALCSQQTPLDGACMLSKKRAIHCSLKAWVHAHLRRS